MAMGRANWAAVTLALLTAGTVRANDLLAVRPGVMCVSADALAKLILHNGDSRTHAPAPRPQDLAVAAAGGCIDIPPGARVTVQQEFNNTSIATYNGPGAPPGGRMIVANVDFASATSSSTPPPPSFTAPSFTAPTGYAVAQRQPMGPDGNVLVLLQDRRLTPVLRDKLWGRGGSGNALEPNDPLLADLNHKPLLSAQLLQLSADGQVIAQRLLDSPLAKLEPAPQRGLPWPAFLVTVDHSAGTSSSDAPGADQLAPLRASVYGKPAPADAGPNRPARRPG